jgi:hypothetical protein
VATRITYGREMCRRSGFPRDWSRDPRVARLLRLPGAVTADPRHPRLASNDRVLGGGHLVASYIPAVLVYLRLDIARPRSPAGRTATLAFDAASAFGLIQPYHHRLTCQPFTHTADTPCSGGRAPPPLPSPAAATAWGPGPARSGLNPRCRARRTGAAVPAPTHRSCRTGAPPRWSRPHPLLKQGPSPAPPCGAARTQPRHPL